MTSQAATNGGADKDTLAAHNMLAASWKPPAAASQPALEWPAWNEPSINGPQHCTGRESTPPLDFRVGLTNDPRFSGPL